MQEPESEAMSEDDGKRLLNALLRHVVTFTGAYVLRSKPTEEQHFNWSCFLITIDDQWYMTTAGHILDSSTPKSNQGNSRSLGKYLQITTERVHHTSSRSHLSMRITSECMHMTITSTSPCIALNYLEVEQLKANGRAPVCL